MAILDPSNVLGKVTAFTANTVTYIDANWLVNAHAGKYIFFHKPGVAFLIASNTNNQITFGGVFTVTLDETFSVHIISGAPAGDQALLVDITTIAALAASAAVDISSTVASAAAAAASASAALASQTAASASESAAIAASAAHSRQTGDRGMRGRRGLTGATGPVGAGDMTIAVYDPTAVSGDAFDMGSMVESATGKVFTDTERTKLAAVNTGRATRSFFGQL